MNNIFKNNTNSSTNILKIKKTSYFAALASYQRQCDQLTAHR